MDECTTPECWEDAIQAVSDWMIEKTLGPIDLQELLDGMCQHLIEAGLPLSRGHAAMNTLHPMYQAETVTWSAIGGSGGQRIPHRDRTSEAWLRSPLRPSVEDDLPEDRFRLAGDGRWRAFPLLVELSEKGATDYLVLPVKFDDGFPNRGRVDGVVTAWTTNAPDGFSDTHLTALRRLVPRFAVAARMARSEQTAVNILSAYLGGDAARRVLAGQIKRGDGDLIPSVIWYSDLRKSTTLADELPGDEFLGVLNDFFESTAGAVLDHGGDVLRFIGDAVLAIFPVGEGAFTYGTACRTALEAAHEAEARLELVNRERTDNGKPALAMGLGLHVGEVMFGNIGTPERVEFSVIGPAANEVARIEALTKDLGRDIVVSEAFARHLDVEWESLGAHEFRGVAGTRELFAPPLE